MPQGTSKIYGALAKAREVRGPKMGEGERLLGPKLGKPLDWITELVAPSEPTPLDLLMAVPIPFARAAEVLGSGLPEALIRRSKSRILNRILESELGPPEARIGSRTVKEVASGQNPRELVPAMRLDPTGSRMIPSPGVGIPRHERRLAQDDLYRISQRLLEEMGIRPEETVTLFRGGPLYRPGFRLTPTSTERKIASGFASVVEEDSPLGNIIFGDRLPLELSSFEVPRPKIRAAAGTLARGDDVTLSEMLVPSIDLAKSATSTPPGLRVLPANVTGVPSRLRKEVARIGKMSAREQEEYWRMLNDRRIGHGLEFANRLMQESDDPAAWGRAIRLLAGIK